MSVGGGHTGKCFSREKLGITMFVTLVVVIEAGWPGMLAWSCKRLLFG